MSVPDQFAHPWVLLLAIVPAALLILGAAGHTVSLPFDNRVHIHRRWLERALTLASRMPALMLLFAVIMVARPQHMQQPRALRSVTNIQICLDVSGSMLSDSRYENAAEAVTNFTFARQGDTIGLTFFGLGQVRWVPLTSDLQVVRNALPFANPARQPSHMQGTAIGACLRFVCKNIEAEAVDGDRLIILVTDGESDDAQGGNQYALADMLHEAGCVLYYIHVARGELTSDVAELARLTGGEALAASDSAGLKGVFEHINRMRPAKQIPQSRAPMDDLRGLTIATLATLLVHVASSWGVRHTPW
jgi:Ca-activated chloride channel family protein